MHNDARRAALVTDNGTQRGQPTAAIDLTECVDVRPREKLLAGTPSASAVGLQDLSTVPHSFRVFFRAEAGVVPPTPAALDFYAEDDEQRSAWLAAVGSVVARMNGRNAWLACAAAR